MSLKYYLNRMFFALSAIHILSPWKLSFRCSVTWILYLTVTTYCRIGINMPHTLFLCDFFLPVERCGGCDTSGIAVGLCWNGISTACFLWVISSRCGLVIGMSVFLHIVCVRIVCDVRHVCGGHLLLIPWLIATEGCTSRFRSSWGGFWGCLPIGPIIT